MKRDLDLIRGLMEAFEDCPAGEPIFQVNLDTEKAEAEVAAHINLLIDIGYLKGECSWMKDFVTVNPDGTRSASHISLRIEGITWTGYDFLDAARNEEVWAVTKTRLKKAGSWTFGLAVEMLKEEAKKRLGEFLPS